MNSINFLILKSLVKVKFANIINIASDSQSYISQILRNIHLVKEDFQWLNQSKSEWDYNVEILPKKSNL